MERKNSCFYICNMLYQSPYQYQIIQSVLSPFPLSIPKRLKPYNFNTVSISEYSVFIATMLLSPLFFSSHQWCINSNHPFSLVFQLNNPTIFSHNDVNASTANHHQRIFLTITIRLAINHSTSSQSLKSRKYYARLDVPILFIVLLSPACISVAVSDCSTVYQVIVTQPLFTQICPHLIQPSSQPFLCTCCPFSNHSYF